MNKIKDMSQAFQAQAGLLLYTLHRINQDMTIEEAIEKYKKGEMDLNAIYTRNKDGDIKAMFVIQVDDTRAQLEVDIDVPEGVTQ